MLKFNNYPPKEPDDVEFTNAFRLIHRSFDPFKMGALVTKTLLENMNPEDRHQAPEIMAHLIETYPEQDGSSRIIYSSLVGRMIPHRTFVSSVEAELGRRLPIGVEV